MLCFGCNNLVLPIIFFAYNLFLFSLVTLAMIKSMVSSGTYFPCIFTYYAFHPARTPFFANN